MPLRIRDAVPGDAEALAGIYNHYVLNTPITFDLEPVSRDNRLTWMAQFDNPRHRLMIGEVDDRIVGYACSTRFRTKPAYDRSVETTIYLQHEAGGQGYGRALYGSLLDALATTDTKRCYGVIALPNDASVGLHKQFGFIEVGHLTEVGYKFDQYWDTLWLEKRF